MGRLELKMLDKADASGGDQARKIREKLIKGACAGKSKLRAALDAFTAHEKKHEMRGEG